MKKNLLALILLLILSFTSKSYGQSCFGNFAGPDINLPCAVNCTPFTATVPEIRSTENYTVASIPYNPYPYTTAAPALTLPCANQDDKFFASSALPFPFCFYGQTYNALVVGTNGLISFDLSNNLNCNQWQLTSPAQPIPFAGTGSQCGTNCPTPGGVLYPRASIMGVYQDIDIDNASPGKKMEFRIEGTAPCRRAVISFNQIANFSCTNLFSTSEIVIYETTGIVEIYVQDKPSGCSWNGDAAIMGIQNWNRDAGLAPPGRNLGSWGSAGMNEAWQFKPNGASSLLDHVELLLNGTLVATGTVGALVNGFYNVDFGNVCPPTGNNNYVVRGYYKTCNDNPTLYTLEDTVQINRVASFSTNGTPTSPLCFGLATATVTFNPIGTTGPYQYSNNGGTTYQASNVFTGLLAGPNTFRVKDINNCTNDTTIVITQPAAVINTLTKTDVSCTGGNTGSITATYGGGTPPYMIKIDGGAYAAATGSPQTFNGLGIGSHTVCVKDVNACELCTSITLNQAPAVTNVLSKTDVLCNGGSTGTVIATYGGGIPPYTINIDGGAFAAATGSPQTFTGLGIGSHTVCVKDNFNCQQCASITINQPPVLTNSLTKTDALCNGGSSGTVTATYGGGVGPYQINIDGGAYAAATGSPQTFNGLAAGSHTVCVQDFNACVQCTNIIVNEPTAVTNVLSKTDVLCSGTSTGTVTTTYGGGTGPYTINIDGGAYAPATGSPQTFNGLPAGNHTICVKDNNACILCSSITINSPAAVTNTLTETDALCFGSSTGTITITYGGGTPPYFVKIDGGAYAAATGSPQTFLALLAGSHTVCVKDNNGCELCKSITINQPPSFLTAATVITPTSCANVDGSIAVIAGNGTPAYQYSIDGGLTYQASNIFTGLPVGNYLFTVKDANGCTASTSGTMTLNDTMRLSLGPDSTICFGSSLTLIPQTNALTDTFKWRPATWLNYDSVKTPVASPPDTTQYILTAKWGLCQRTDTIIINVKHKPVPFAGRDTTICYKSIALLNGSASNLSGTVNYNWSPSANVVPANAANAIARPDTTQQYILTVTDNYGCNFSVSDSMMVFMEAPVSAFAGNDTNAVLGVPHQLYATGGVSYIWSPSVNLNNPFAQNPLATLYNDTYFRVQVTDAAGCIGYDDVFIKVYAGPTYYVPNSFSPNGDGLNDIFRPIPVGISATDFFNVYNRYGELVFQTNQWLRGWDGKYKGKDAPMGTYVWMVKGTDRNGRVVEMKGTVTLIR